PVLQLDNVGKPRRFGDECRFGGYDVRGLPGGKRSAGRGLPQAQGAGFALLRRQRADGFRRSTRIYKAAPELRFRENGRIRRDQRAILHHGAIENDNIILDHAIVANGTSMHDRVAPHGDAIADNGWKEVLRDMDRAGLAEKAAVAYADEMAIATDRRAARDDRVRARLDLTEHARAWAKEARPLAEAWLDTIEGQD